MLRRPGHLWTAVAIVALAVAGCTPIVTSATDTAATGQKRPPAPSPRYYSGLGFDACTAPSTSTMSAWLASPYRAIGIYIGGNSRGCNQPNLTPSWVSTVKAQGWSLLPLYVGSQAPSGCTTVSYSNRISGDPFGAALQGISSAEDAVTQARTLGLAGGTPIYYDLEAYTRSAACSGPVKAFVHHWVERLNARGYIAGFYSSSASGIADQVAFVSDPGYSPPDSIWFANWNNNPSLFGDPWIPNNYWSLHQRHHQYRGPHVETWGGVSINIDNDSSDGPAVTLADWREPSAVFRDADGPRRP